MRKINRKGEPDFWKEYRRMHPKMQYKDLKDTEEGNELRRSLREHLLQSQHGLCGYCCRKVELEHSLNEHMKPQSIYPKESMDYKNLIVSCKTEGAGATCGVSKENNYDENLFVSPLEDNCEKEFVFYPNGQIEGVGKRGKYTCEILNLDAYELQRARKAQYKTCESYKDPEMVLLYFLTPDEEGKLEAYADMVQFFYERGDFGILNIQS